MARKKTIKPINGQRQQGDVLIKVIKAIPAQAVETKNAVIAEGEGHHLHRIADPAAVTMYTVDGIKYARVNQDTCLEHVTVDGRHGEHNAVPLYAGESIMFGQVMEHDYLSEMARPVVD